MLEEAAKNERIKLLAQKAAGVHQWMKDLHTMTMTMRLVGFTKKECKNSMLQQRIQKLAMRMTMPLPSSIVASNDGTSVSELSSPVILQLGLAASSATMLTSLKWNTGGGTPQALPANSGDTSSSEEDGT